MLRKKVKNLLCSILSEAELLIQSSHVLKKDLRHTNQGILEMAAKPIKPSEIVEAKVKLFPDFVLETWNAAIAKNWANNRSLIKQPNMIVALIAASPKSIDRSDVFDNNWLDIEDVYRADGWKVEYDKPGYNESYDAYFVFKKS